MLLIELLRPLLLGGVFLPKWGCIVAGCLMLFMATGIHSWRGALESLVFLIPAVFLTLLLRILRTVRI